MDIADDEGTLSARLFCSNPIRLLFIDYPDCASLPLPHSASATTVQVEPDFEQCEMEGSIR